MARGVKSKNSPVWGKAKPAKTGAARTKRKTAKRVKPPPAVPQETDLLARVSDGFAAFDADMNYTYVNRRGAEMLGRKPTELIGKNYWVEFPEAKGTPFANAYIKALKTQKPLAIEDYYAPWKRWFENRIYPYKEGLSIFFTDITERRQAEIALYNSEARLANILAHVAEGVIVISDDQRIESFNNAAKNIFGYEEAEVIGKPLDVLMPGRFAKAHRNYMKEFAASDKPGRTMGKHGEITCVRKGGTEFLSEVGISKYIENGRVFFTAIMHDISARKQAQEQQYRLTQVMELSLNEIYIFDRDTLLFTYVNRGARRNLGYSMEELSGLTPVALKPEFTEASFREMIRPLLLHEREILVFETLHLRKDKTTYPVEVHLQLIESGATSHFAAIIHDITERKRAESALQQRAAELNALYLSAQRLQKILAPSQLSAEIIDTLEQTVGYDFGAVLLLEKNSNRLTPFALSAQKQGPEFVKRDKNYIESHDLRPGRGVTGWVAQNGISALIGDVRRDARYYAVRDDIRSELCVPLRLGGEVIGVVNVESAQPDAYTLDDQRLLETVAAQIAVAIQNSRLLEETRLSRDRLAELSRRLVETRESEARAIGRELHDQIGQMLTAMKITLDMAGELPPDAAAKQAGKARRIVEDLTERVSRLTLELRPPMLDDLGLIPALTWHVNHYQEETGIAVDFEHSGLEGVRFTAEIETTAYRIVQEALTNVARHAGAKRVRVEVRQSGEEIEIRIEDDGVGFDPQKALALNRGLGGMRERAQLVGGTFDIESEPGNGSRKTIRLPARERA